MLNEKEIAVARLQTELTATVAAVAAKNPRVDAEATAAFKSAGDAAKKAAAAAAAAAVAVSAPAAAIAAKSAANDAAATASAPALKSSRAHHAASTVDVNLQFLLVEVEELQTRQQHLAMDMKAKRDQVATARANLKQANTESSAAWKPVVSDQKLSKKAAQDAEACV